MRASSGTELFDGFRLCEADARLGGLDTSGDADQADITWVADQRFVEFGDRRT